MTKRAHCICVQYLSCDPAPQEIQSRQFGDHFAFHGHAATSKAFQLITGGHALSASCRAWYAIQRHGSLYDSSISCVSILSLVQLLCTGSHDTTGNHEKMSIRRSTPVVVKRLDTSWHKH